MDYNPFEAPRTQVDTAEVQESDRVRWYVVSPAKFWTLFVVTMSLYAVYWSYRNWSLHKARTRASMWPIARGLFLIFFMHSLAGRIAEDAERAGYRLISDLRSTATLVVILMVVNRILDRLTGENIGFPAIDLLSFAMIPALGYGFWIFQRDINGLSGDPQGRGNAGFGVVNILFLVVFGLLWLLILLGYAYLAIHGPEAGGR